jgi:hypothetical protein
VGGVGAGGCNQPVFIAENRPLSAVAQPTMAGQDANMVLSDTDLFVLPVHKPTSDEAKALKTEQEKLGLKMPVPWVGVRDVAIEVDWTIKNLSPMPNMVRVTINGGNEFGDYEPMLYVIDADNPDDQQSPPNMLNNGDFIAIDGNAVLTGIFREDELANAALDLEAVTRYPAPNVGMNEPYEVFLRNPTASRVGLEGIPANDVTPAVVRMNILLEAMAPAALDYTVRVRENGNPRDKLAAHGDKNLYVSTVAVLAPPVLPTANPPATN